MPCSKAFCRRAQWPPTRRRAVAGCGSAVAGGIVVAMNALSCKPEGHILQPCATQCDAGSGGHAVRGSVSRYLGVCACVDSIPVHFLTGSSGLARLAVAVRGPDECSFSSTCTASMPPPLAYQPFMQCARVSVLCGNGESEKTVIWTCNQILKFARLASDAKRGRGKLSTLKMR